jgi:4-amino-4-deoxy-L-arabinose transferase-like glycosyltransferase
VTTERRFHTADAAFLAVLVVLGAGLRFYRIETGLWFDEIVTLLDSVRPPLSAIVTHFPSNNDHPLYSVLAHLAVSALGEGPGALRLPSVLFGVAAIPLLYLVGTSVTNRLEAGAAALILTFSYHHIWFSQNARGYTALLCCVLLSTFALIRWFDTGRKSFLLLYAVVTAVGSYAHLTMVLVCVSHALACVVDWASQGGASRVRLQGRAVTAAFIGAGVFTIALYAPMLLDVGAFFATESSTAVTTEVATPLWAMVAALRGLQTGFGQLWAIALGGLLFAAGAWSYFRQRSTVALLLLLPVPVTVLVMLAMDRPIRPRFVLFAIGFGLLMAVRGAAWVGALFASLTTGRVTPQRSVAATVALLTIGVVALSIRSLPYGYRFPKQDYEQAVSFVERSKGDADIAAAIGETTATPVLEYLERPWRRVDEASQLRALLDEGTQVWAIYTFPEYIEAGQPDLWAMLQKECAEVNRFTGTVDGGDITVRRCP